MNSVYKLETRNHSSLCSPAVLHVVCFLCFVQGMDMKFLRAALTMAKTAVYSLHKTSTREVSSVYILTSFTALCMKTGFVGL